MNQFTQWFVIYLVTLSIIIYRELVVQLPVWLQVKFPD